MNFLLIFIFTKYTHIYFTILIAFIVVYLTLQLTGVSAQIYHSSLILFKLVYLNTLTKQIWTYQKTNKRSLFTKSVITMSLTSHLLNQIYTTLTLYLKNSSPNP